ncbi:cGMP-specific 3',5'-cyclic phosphodiesterase-like [Venturia canescens]|uniref:cGMP-specific 3',5'-cyclic phosphodiesterase-like n=1 Tax=Venturia canescens TaxID=32260 RepID=UPI001C9C0FF7|nr:cGMP-specific 3',5'-cyclic phosphodiesterase-like [Venturia canescens]XP_043266965.1 cGMP-specific 3',5'-cyclic phosphodiesterase-like [Venturia canescens]XP_043266966.1 cGMP-specific 3',5'-cyclic phosphodiesterase-like [Venturia canescens]XP_043266967.1 cGMP-specific 3',5'-cyclic phosphodiesterase-like [Venturia canescens]XP_043266968.1 cGMP-specific 3',5'-cyclic phosphodiesterase-like [Venturia canescens]
MEAEEEVDEEQTGEDHEEINHNNDFENYEASMKISMMPTGSTDSPEQKATLLKSSTAEPLIIRDFEERKSHLPDERQKSTESENDEQTESKVNLSTSAKTDGTREGGETLKLTRSKRISCQDTIHEVEEDDGLTMDRVGKYLEANPAIVEAWLRNKASTELRRRLETSNVLPKSTSLSLRHEESVLVRSKRNSVTSDLFQSWLASSSPIKRSKSPTRPSISWVGRREELDQLDEGELFMELIRDVANELDINVLCHKILVNVGILTHADRGSLFLAKGPLEDRYLVAKLFDVTQDTELSVALQRAKNEEIKIPFGVGIAGYVAQTKEIINIKDAYKDPRFNSAIDMRTGYKTILILSMPICNYEGDVIGVAQIINKTNGSNEFTDRDVEVFQRYLTFCGIGIQNAQLFELSVQEYRRNQILLNLARSIFEEQNNLECLVTKIMTEAKELLKCERCAVYLLDLDCGEAGHLEKIVERPGRSIQEDRKPLSRRESNNIDMEDIFQRHTNLDANAKFTMVFEMENGTQEARIYRPTLSDLSTPLGKIARYVATTGQILNIGDVETWLKKEVWDTEKEPIKSILCMPIVNGQRSVIGVAQLINKDNGSAFADSDVSIFEAFAIFCGLGIHNTQMYESACKLMAKQKVALECLSYHATASNDDAFKLTSDTIPSADKYNLYSFKFIDFDLSDDDTCRATVRMFKQCDLIQRFHIPYDVLCRWILSVKKNYRPVKYHNWRHALNVAQTMFAMLKTGKMEQFMTDLEILGLLVACLCHDLDHRGTNNAFQTKTESPLAILYSTSTMEHHHFDQCVMILNSDSNNIFQTLSMEDYRKVMRVVENAILSTDLAVYFKKKNRFMELIDEGEFDWQSEEKKDLLCGMMMTACDVSAIAKPWEIQHRVAKLVADEFFDQGDLEKLQLNQQPVAMMDRERRDELPQMQVGFIDVICMPLYKVLSETFPWILPLYEGTTENRKNWQDLAEKVEMGLTWIDRDTIEEPVEEFISYEPKDIEFTVTTLNCTQNEKKDVSGVARTSECPKTALGRFASLRKGGRSLGKGVRHRLSRSLYARSSSEDTGKAKVLLPERKSRNKLCLLI